MAKARSTAKRKTAKRKTTKPKMSAKPQTVAKPTRKAGASSPARGSNRVKPASTTSSTPLTRAAEAVGHALGRTVAVVTERSPWPAARPKRD
jgi:hypothetical protein